MDSNSLRSHKDAGHEATNGKSIPFQSAQTGQQIIGSLFLLQHFVGAAWIDRTADFRQAIDQHIQLVFQSSGVLSRAEYWPFHLATKSTQQMPEDHPFLLLQTSSGDVFVEVAELQHFTGNPHWPTINIMHFGKIVVEQSL